MDIPPQELALALRARNNDSEALALLVERSRTRLFALAFAELRHYQDAEDAVASALVRICAGIGALRDPTRVREWMHTVVRNEARRIALRREKDAAESCLEEAAAPDDTGLALLRVSVRSALRSLPAQEARALALFYWGGLSIHEIAVRVERPEGTVKSWLHHGRRHLARELEEPPMAGSDTAVILGGAGEEAQGWEAALRRAGYGEVRRVTTYLEAASLRETGEGEGRELHLPPALAGADLLLLNEWLEGRSAFEVTALLKATVERERLALGLLLEPRPEPEMHRTLLAAWITGFDLVLAKPVVPAELERFGKLLRTHPPNTRP